MQTPLLLLCVMLEEIAPFAASSACDDASRRMIHATTAALHFANAIMPQLVLLERGAVASKSVGSMAGYQCPRHSHYVRMPLDGLPVATKSALQAGEFFVCPVTGAWHECGPDRCTAAKRVGATEVCPLTSRTWPFHDSTAIAYEERSQTVLRPTYVNQIERRVKKRLDAMASDEAFRDTLHRDALFGETSQKTAMSDEKERHIMELLAATTTATTKTNATPTPPSVSVAAAAATAASATKVSKRNAAAAEAKARARAAKAATEAAKAAAAEAEMKRKQLHDRLAAEEKIKAAIEKEEARRQRALQRANEAKARKPTARRGEVDKELRPVSTVQKMKHSSKFDYHTRRIPKSATTAQMKDPLFIVGDIDRILRKVFVEPFKNPADRAHLSPEELKYLYDRCRALWQEITQSPACALRSNDYDPINTILFVMFHGMRGNGITTTRYTCLPQTWSCSSKADIAQAAEILGIPNRLSQRAEMIRRMLDESEQIAELEQRLVTSARQQRKATAMTEREKRSAAIHAWRVPTGETYAELVRRFAERFDTPNAMPVSFCHFSSSARYPPPLQTR